MRKVKKIIGFFSYMLKTHSKENVEVCRYNFSLSGEECFCFGEIKLISVPWKRDEKRRASDLTVYKGLGHPPLPLPPASIGPNNTFNKIIWKYFQAGCFIKIPFQPKQLLWVLRTAGSRVLLKIHFQKLPSISLAWKRVHYPTNGSDWYEIFIIKR